MATTPPSLLGARVGHIRIVDVLGEGGMGAVYIGFDEKLQRKVAVKALHDRRLDTDSRVRFLREARALSQLKHPHICQIHDYLEEDGRAYLVLELIEGRSLKDVIAGRPDTAARLRIADELVEVLAATHAQGIIHRDLKPSNVMVTPTGDVKVLDFGLARATREDEPTLEVGAQEARPGAAREDDYAVTKLGMLVGTLSYMSPEQARGEALTTASDIYSCGLVLQELFTGEPAYELRLKPAELLARAGAGQTLPVSGLDPEMTSLVNRMKAVEPAVRPRALDAAERLRWIRERPRRRLQRLVLVGALVAATAVAVGMSYQAYRIRQEAQRANREAAAARQVSDFLVKLFQVSDPGDNRGNTVTARALLDKAAQDIEGRLQDQPLLSARLQHTMARVYFELGLYDKARVLAERGLVRRRGVLGETDPAIGESLALIGHAYALMSQLAEAEPPLLRALEIQEKALGNEDPQVAQTLNHLAYVYAEQGKHAQAEPLFRRALEIREGRLGPDHADVAETLNDLAGLLSNTRRPEEAISLLRRAIAIWEKSLGPDHPYVPLGLHNLARTLQDVHDYEEASRVADRGLRVAEKVLGAEHPDLHYHLQLASTLLTEGGRYPEAEPLITRAAALALRTRGLAHTRTETALRRLAQLHHDLGRLDQAGSVYRQAIEAGEKGQASPPLRSRDLQNLGDWYREQGRFKEAEPLYRRALEVLSLADQGESPVAAEALRRLAQTAASLRRHDEAEAQYRQALTIAEKAHGPDHLNVAETLAWQGAFYRETGRDAESAAAFERAVAILPKALPRGPLTQSARVQNATILMLAGRTAEARPLVDRILATGYRRPGFLELGPRDQVPTPPR